MPERPDRPRRPGGRPPDPSEDDALTFDARRGRRSSGASDQDSARAIPTGKRGRDGRPRPASERPRAQRRRDQGGEHGTRVMPTSTPPSRPSPERAARSGNGPGRPSGPEAPRRPGPPERRRRPFRKVLSVLLVLALVWGVAMAWAVGSAWSEVNRVAATPGGDRPSSEGRNVLLVGSDARAELTEEQRRELGTGSDTGGARTDTILVLHTGSEEPTLMSIPRDSYVEIPGHGMDKINAAYSIGGPELLGQTIEQNTGLELDGYMEIGFGGFSQVVDAVDGVPICVENDMDDEKAHIDLEKGCQTLDGPTALGYVRARYSDPEGDLGRAERQREFLGALMGELVTPANMLLPWRVHSLGTQSAEALTVGEGDSLIGTARTFWAFRTVAKGDGNSITVPVAEESLATPSGTAVTWDEARSDAIFEALREDEPLEITPGDG